MTTPISKRVQKHRRHLRQSGLRPIQIWVPDTRNPNFSAECERQSKLVAQADMSDVELLRFMEEALLDTKGWNA
jgi:hypothetical protein